MKKRLIFLLLAELVAATLHAQEGEIIYTDYGPDGLSYEWQLVYEELPADWTYSGDIPLELDFDHDGVTDCYYNVWVPWLADDYPLTTVLSLKFPWHDSIPVPNYRMACVYRNHYEDGETGDTIPNVIWDLKYNSQYDFPYFWPNDYYYPGEYYMYSKYIAFRVQVGDKYNYGWIRQRIECITYPQGYLGWPDVTEVCMPKVTILAMAYCTIPDYPLRLGQTSFEWSWSVEETDATALVTLHPNPTNSQVTVSGKNLKQAEVVNLLGQRVATVAGEGETLHIDLSGLPAGIYFVNVTDSEGRKCVRKVVKE